MAFPVCRDSVLPKKTQAGWLLVVTGSKVKVFYRRRKWSRNNNKSIYLPVNNVRKCFFLGRESVTISLFVLMSCIVIDTVCLSSACALRPNECVRACCIVWGDNGIEF